MNRRVPCVLTATLGVALLLSLGSVSPTQEALPQPKGEDVQARGPVHEAYARPDAVQPEQGPVVTKQPPDAVEEVPPDQKPAGANVQWIPGYWGWDDDTKDFLWVSGSWRDAPPGRSWMAGHWQQIDTGWLWITGFWAPNDIQQTQYLPPPPPTLDTGPSVPAPNPNSFYAAGCWVYRENHYMWRPGQWLAFQANWLWVPPHYVWTPTGCIFIDGYWDYPLEECGLLFAPCRFDLAIWARRPWIPSFCVHVDFLIGSLFVGPHHHHYYFGDYFEPLYAKRGFVAWTDYHPIPGVFDNHFAYYRHLHAGEPKWESSLRELYRGRLTGEVPRPPRTLALQYAAIKAINLNKTGNVLVHKDLNFTHLQNVSALSTIKEMHNSKVTLLGSLSGAKAGKVVVHEIKLQNVSKEEILREQKAAKQIHDTAIVRRDTEAKMLLQGGIPVKHTDAPKVVAVMLPKPLPPVVMAPVVVRKPPALVVHPAHEERPIPKYEPPHPPGPPKKEKEKKV